MPPPPSTGSSFSPGRTPATGRPFCSPATPFRRPPGGETASGRRARDQALYTSLYEVGDLAGARQALERADGLIPEQDRVERAHFLNNRGTVLAAERRLGLARHDFEQALGLDAGKDPEFSRGILNDLTEVSLEEGDAVRAAGYLKRTLAHLDPGRKPAPSVFYYRSWVDQANGHLAAAAEDLAPALGADLNSEWGWKIAYQQGQVAEARGDLRTAEAAYGRSIAVLEEMRAASPSTSSSPGSWRSIGAPSKRCSACRPERGARRRASPRRNGRRRGLSSTRSCTPSPPPLSLPKRRRPARPGRPTPRASGWPISSRCCRR